MLREGCPSSVVLLIIPPSSSAASNQAQVPGVDPGQEVGWAVELVSFDKAPNWHQMDAGERIKVWWRSDETGRKKVEGPVSLPFFGNDAFLSSLAWPLWFPSPLTPDGGRDKGGRQSPLQRTEIRHCEVQIRKGIQGDCRLLTPGSE